MPTGQQGPGGDKEGAAPLKKLSAGRNQVITPKKSRAFLKLFLKSGLCGPRRGELEELRTQTQTEGAERWRSEQPCKEKSDCTSENHIF